MREWGSGGVGDVRTVSDGYDDDEHPYSQRSLNAECKS